MGFDKHYILQRLLNISATALAVIGMFTIFYCVDHNIQKYNFM